MRMNACNPSSWETEVRGPEVTGIPGLHSKFSKIEYGICVLVSKAKQMPPPPQTKVLQGMIAPQLRSQKTGQRTSRKKLSLGHDLGLIISQIVPQALSCCSPYRLSLDSLTSLNKVFKTLIEIARKEGGVIRSAGRLSQTTPQLKPAVTAALW